MTRRLTELTASICWTHITCEALSLVSLPSLLSFINVFINYSNRSCLLYLRRSGMSHVDVFKNLSWQIQNDRCGLTVDIPSNGGSAILRSLLVVPLPLYIISHLINLGNSFQLVAARPGNYYDLFFSWLILSLALRDLHLWIPDQVASGVCFGFTGANGGSCWSLVCLQDGAISQVSPCQKWLRESKIPKDQKECAWGCVC